MADALQCVAFSYQAPEHQQVISGKSCFVSEAACYSDIVWRYLHTAMAELEVPKSIPAIWALTTPPCVSVFGVNEIGTSCITRCQLPALELPCAVGGVCYDS